MPASTSQRRTKPKVRRNSDVIRLHKPVAAVVSEACQINDLDHGLAFGERAEFVSEACQINDLDHVDHAAKTLH